MVRTPVSPSTGRRINMSLCDNEVHRHRGMLMLTIVESPTHCVIRTTSCNNLRLVPTSTRTKRHSDDDVLSFAEGDDLIPSQQLSDRLADTIKLDRKLKPRMETEVKADRCPVSS